MAQPDDGEMVAVERSEPALAQAIDHRQHSRVDEAEPEVRILAQQLADPVVVAGLENFDCKRAAANVGQEAGDAATGTK